MAEHPNAVLVREALDAFQRGDYEASAANLADDVVWHYLGADEPLRGKAAVLERGPASFDAEISGELHDVVANDEHVLAMLKVHAERKGRSLDYAIIEVYHVRDGKCTERWAFSDDTAAIIDFFA